VSADHHPDLFWAIRGGGGNAGVVTSFEYRAHPVGPALFEANVWYPLEQAEQALRGWREYVADAPDELSSIAMVWSVPDGPEFPEELRRKPVLILGGVYCGSVEDGERAMARLGEFGDPLLDLSGPTTYLTIQTGFDPYFREGLRCYWKSIYLQEMSDAVIELTAEHARSRPSGRSLIAIRHLGGAIARVGEDETAYAHRDAEFLLSLDSCWTDPAETEANIAWTRSSWAELERESGGGIYLNFSGFGEEGEALPRAVHSANYPRLVEIKRRYDPTNLFRSTTNVTP
jgi:FAD/FMN-containing dehydrogenase